METKKKALGKGLEQLFSNNVIDFDNFEDTVIEENKKARNYGVEELKAMLEVDSNQIPNKKL